MKYLKILFLFFFVQFYAGQEVYLTRVEKTSENTDRFLYKIGEEGGEAQYLGEIEVRGFSKDDAAIFSLIYKKAKEIGANAFSLKPFENIDGSLRPLDPSNYKLALYYLPKNKFRDRTGNLYLFASSGKDQKIAVNKKDYILAPRTYLLLKTVPGELYAVSTKKFLGSAVKIQPKENDPNMYFMISGAKIKADDTGTGGLNLKSGDIMGLEKSYAEFLSIIYKEEKRDD